MPTRRIGPAGLAACVLGGALVLVVAALATVPYAIERLLDRGGEVGGVRWSASGASFSWPLDFKADTLVVEKDGVRVSMVSPAVLLGFEDGIFGDHPLEAKARKVEVVRVPGTPPEDGADAGGDSPDGGSPAAGGEKEPGVPALPAHLALPLAASVGIDSLEADLGGEKISAAGISLSNPSGKSAELKVAELRSPRLDAPASVDLRADWSGDSLDAHVALALPNDTIRLDARAPVEDLRLYDAEADVAIADPKKISEALKDAPIVPRDIRVKAKATALVGSPLPRYETDVVFRTDTLYPLPPLLWRLKAAGLGKSVDAQIEAKGPRAERVSFKGRRTASGEISAQGGVHGMDIDIVHMFKLPIDFTVPSAEWDGKRLAATVVTKEGTRVEAKIDHLADSAKPMRGTFTMHMSPDEPWADTWTNRNTHYERGITYGEFGAGMVDMDVRLAGVTAYGFAAESLLTHLKIDKKGLVFWDAKLVHDGLDYPIRGEVVPFGDEETLMFRVDLPSGGVARVEGPIFEKLTLSLKEIPIRELPLGVKEETIHSLPGTVNGKVERDMRSGISDGVVQVAATLGASSDVYAGRLRFVNSRDSIWLDSVSVRQGVNTVHGQALFVFDEEERVLGGLQEASVRTDGLQLSQVSLPWLKGIDLSGELSGSLHFNAKLEIDGGIRADSLRLRSGGRELVSSPRLAMDAKGEAVRISGLVRPVANEEIEGELLFSAESLFGETRLFSLDYRASSQGRVRATASLGPTLDLAGDFRADGDWSLPDGSVSLAGSELNGSLSYSFRRGFASLRANASQSGGDLAFAGIRFPLRTELQVADGVAAAHAELRNDLGERVELDAEADLAENALRRFEFGTERFSAALSEDETVTLLGARGTLEGRRAAVRAPGVRYERRLGKYGRLSAAVAGADLRYSFAEGGRRARLEGSATLDSLLFEKMDVPELSIWSLMQMIPKLFQHRKRGGGDASGAVAARRPTRSEAIDLDFRLNDSGKDALWAKTNVFLLPLSVSLQVHGTTQNPLLEGDVRAADNGWLELQSDRYEIPSAQVEWFSQPLSKGSIEIRASRELPICNATREEEDERCDVALRVGGTIEKLGLTAEAEGCSRQLPSRNAVQSLQFGCVMDDGDQNNLTASGLQLAESAIESAGRDATRSLNKAIGANLLGSPKISLAKGAQNALAHGESSSFGDADSASFSGELPFNIVDSTLILSISYTKATGSEATYNDITRAAIQWFFHNGTDTTDYWQGRWSFDMGAQIRTFLSEAENGSDNQLEFSTGVSHSVGFWGDCLFGRCRDRSRGWSRRAETEEGGAAE